MAFMERLCLMERGIMPARTITVNRIIATPKLEKKTAYNSTRLLIMGRIITPFQTSLSISMVSAQPSAECSACFLFSARQGIAAVGEVRPLLVRAARSDCEGSE